MDLETGVFSDHRKSGIQYSREICSRSYSIGLRGKRLGKIELEAKKQPISKMSCPMDDTRHILKKKIPGGVFLDR